MGQATRGDDGYGLVGIPAFDRLAQRPAHRVTSLDGGLGWREIGIEENRHQRNRPGLGHKASHDEIKSMPDALLRRNRARVRNIELLRDQRFDDLKSKLGVARVPLRFRRLIGPDAGAAKWWNVLQLH